MQIPEEVEPVSQVMRQVVSLLGVIVAVPL
jgi:hypothetical protein